MEQDVFGTALLDYHEGRYTQDIVTYSSLGDEDVLPLPHLFRMFAEMPSIEQQALQLCRGKILDVGCGAGSHALHLQKKGFDVTGLDISLGALQVSAARGLKQTVHTSILDYRGEHYDTLLLLMNGVGLAGTLDHLGVFLGKLKSLLHPQGQVLMDSTDIIYMFETDNDGSYWIPTDTPYYGEIRFEMEYKSLKTEPFPWLYVDYNTLQGAAHVQGLHCELLYEGEHFDFLAKLSLATY